MPFIQNKFKHKQLKNKLNYLQSSYNIIGFILESQLTFEKIQIVSSYNIINSKLI